MTKKEKQELMTQYKKFYVKGWDELLKKLKAHGGEMIVPMPEPEEHVRLLLKDGRIFDSTKLIIKKGEPNGCHQNASRLWAENNPLQLVTGYALDHEHPGLAELWRQHSWCWNPTTGKIIETTEPADKYFGVMLSDVQALKFSMENVPEYEDPEKFSPRMRKCALKFMESMMKEENALLSRTVKKKSS